MPSTDNTGGRKEQSFRVAASAVRAYLDAGLSLIPLMPWNEGGKRPKFKNWAASQRGKPWEPKPDFDGNIGWRLEARHLVIDVDPRNFPKDTEGKRINSLRLLEDRLGLSLEKCCSQIVETGSGGRHYYFKKPYSLRVVTGLADFPGVEFKTKGTQVVAAGSKHPTGRLYRFSFDSLPLTQIRIAPKALLELIRRPEPEHPAASDPGDLTPSQLARVLGGIPVEQYREHGEWIRLMMAAHWATGGQGIEEFVEWSTSDPLYKDHATLIRQRWVSCSTEKSDSITTATLIQEAHKHEHYIDPRVEDPSEDFEPVEFTPNKPALGGSNSWDEVFSTPSSDTPYRAKGKNLWPQESPGTKDDEVKEVYGKDAIVNAVVFCRTNYPGNTILRHNGDFYTFDGKVWKLRDREAISHEIQKRMLPFHNDASQPTVNNTIAAVKNLSLREGVELPCWLGSGGLPPDALPDPHNLVILQNGIVDLSGWDQGQVSNLTLFPHTKYLFVTGLLDYQYNSEALCPRWLEFLNDIWGEDAEQIKLLQQWLGYNLVFDYRHQKIMLLVGLSRSGKGTVEKVMSRVLGEENVAAVSMHSLASNFGLQHLVARKSAVAGDAHKVDRSKRDVAKERLLGISSQDKQVIDRKNRDILSVRLPTRLTLIANEMPPFVDNSDALLNRLLVLRFDKSYAGREDVRLAEKLLEERAGIFNWAVEGLADLGRAGEFLTTNKGVVEKALIRRINNPVSAFLEDCCRYPVKGVWTSSDDLYRAYCAYQERNGNRSKLNTTHFFKTLLQNVPTLKRTRPRLDEGNRLWGYEDIALTELDGMESTEGNADIFG